jgi:hypothetical protein
VTNLLTLAYFLLSERPSEAKAVRARERSAREPRERSGAMGFRRVERVRGSAFAKATADKLGAKPPE